MQLPLFGEAVFNTNDIFSVELIPGQNVTQIIEGGGWIFDLALDGAVEINGIQLSTACWKFRYAEIGDRIIRSVGETQSTFFSIHLHKNPYKDLIFHSMNSDGLFSVEMAYPLLKINFILENRRPDLDADMWLSCYVQLLLIQLNKPDLKRCSFRYEELSKIYKLILALGECSEKFPLPSEIVRQSGINKSRFQKACHAILGQSVQKVIQHLKMTRAYNAILNERREIVDVSTSLGYNHSPNFITAFRTHFGLTPMETVHLKMG